MTKITRTLLTVLLTLSLGTYGFEAFAQTPSDEQSKTEEKVTEASSGQSSEETEALSDKVTEPGAVFDKYKVPELYFTLNNPTDEAVTAEYMIHAFDAEGNEIMDMNSAMFGEPEIRKKIIIPAHAENMPYAESLNAWGAWVDMDFEIVQVSLSDISFEIESIEILPEKAKDISDQVTYEMEEKTDSYNPFHFKLTWPEEIGKLEVHATLVGLKDGEEVFRMSDDRTVKREDDFSQLLVFLDNGVSETADTFELYINSACEAE